MRTKNLSYDHVDITGGFWQERQEMVRNTTIYKVYDRFRETGRFDAFNLDWKEGSPNKPHYFWDSDVAKWMESVAYLTRKKREPQLEAIVNGLVDKIEEGRMEDGYFNIYFELFAPDKRFTFRDNHELYCLGHLIEAAIAYDEATGKRKFLTMMEDYVALVRRVFMVEESAAFDSPGHEEIELALVKLWRYTGKKEYLELAQFFIDRRGQHKKPDDPDTYSRGSQVQDHLPVREQLTAEGHAVRVGYLFTAVADLALETGDKALERAADAVYKNITTRRMYLTGAVGSTSDGEAFQQDYHLPLDTAYAETCAALSMALFAGRMECLDADSTYADTVETIIYNSFLSGVSLDGGSFFYENAQEIDLAGRKAAEGKGIHFPITQRVGVFDCSCCPPNVTRFIPSIGNFLYNYTDDTIYVNQYMDSTAEKDGIRLGQHTDYPMDGTVRLTLTGGDRTLALRIPGWCREYTVEKDGCPVTAPVEKGYALVSVRDGEEVTLRLTLAARLVKADPHVQSCRGRLAVTYGPFVMCMEGVDNGGDLSGVCLADGEITVGVDKNWNLPVLTVPCVRETVEGLYSDAVTRTPFAGRMIPYFAFANRGETDMRIWMPRAGWKKL